MPEQSAQWGVFASLGALGASAGWLLGVSLDLFFMLAQLLMGLFKLALALFLFWLIVDLFLLRTIARAETLGWWQPRLGR